MQGSPTHAFHYLIEGAGLVFRPGFRRFVWAPLLINVIIFVVTTIAVIGIYQDTATYIMALLPSWLQWLKWLLAPLIGLVLLVAYGYVFNIITNFIAAPFFGKLAEKIEMHLTGAVVNDESILLLIPRTLERELTKLWYFISRGLLVLLVFLALFFIPGVNILGTLLGIAWGSWCMVTQYVDYAADNHQLDFNELRKRLGERRLTSYCFGSLVLLGNMIPIVNIVVAPIAVAGATVFWVREVSGSHLVKINKVN